MKCKLTYTRLKSLHSDCVWQYSLFFDLEMYDLYLRYFKLAEFIAGRMKQYKENRRVVV